MSNENTTKVSKCKTEFKWLRHGKRLPLLLSNLAPSIHLNSSRIKTFRSINEFIDSIFHGKTCHKYHKIRMSEVCFPGIPADPNLIVPYICHVYTPPQKKIRNREACHHHLASAHNTIGCLAPVPWQKCTQKVFTSLHSALKHSTRDHKQPAHQKFKRTDS